MLVEQQAAIEVRVRIDRPFTVVGHRAAVQNRAALVVLRFQFDPDVEGVNRAAGEEVADLARAHDDLEPYGVAAPDRDVDLVERSDDVRRRREVVLRGAEVHRLLADRERARQPRLGRADSGGGGLRRFLPAHEPEHVHRNLPVAQERLHRLELFPIVVHERQRGIRRREPVRADHAVLRGRIAGFHERQSAHFCGLAG